jgi:ribosomal protein S18 acetylase RimI-like enzyme
VTPEAVQVRRATEADTDTIGGMYAALHGDQWEHGGEPPRAEREPDWRSEVVASLAAEHIITLVAEAGGEIVGTARLEFGERPYFRIADIRRVYVRPDWRRRGVAGALMRAAEDAARGGGAREARLSVVAENEPALALYRRLGYRHFAIRLAKRI